MKMRIQTTRCTCERPIEFEMSDEYNSIACQTCWEVLSYEKPEKKKFFKIKHLQPTIADFIEVLNRIRPDILC